MTTIVYYLFYIVSLLPFRVLYALSDAGFILVYHVVGYRRTIVRNNLVSAFPEKPLQEIIGIERKFYHWFCDYFLEAIKLLSISDEELRHRFTITNSEEVEACFRQGRDVGAILGHYCNWEWLSCVGIGLPAERVTGLVYDPLHSKAFDALFRRLRTSQPNAITVPKKNILRQLIALRKEGRRSIFGYIADQAPKWQNIHLWLPFLHHDTPVFTGSERIMRKLDNAVFYVEMQRPSRGIYRCTYHCITPHAASTDEYAITRQFFEMLEQTIRREPAYYLWTHNHWKRTKEEFERRFVVVNGKVLERKEVEE